MGVTKNPSSSDFDNDQEIDLADLLNVLIQSWKLIVAVFVVVLVAGLAYAVLSPPVYEADSLIQIESQKGGGTLAGLSQLSESLGVEQSYVTGEIEILKSREVLLNAIDTTQATTRIEVDNRFPLIGGWMARRFQAANPGEVAPPFMGFSGYAWGGEKLELAELELPRRALGSDFYLQITDDGFTLSDADDNILLESDAVGQRLPFTVNGQAASIGIQELTGRPGTRFLINKASPLSVLGSLRSALQVNEAGKNSQVIRVAYENTDKDFATDFVNAVARTYLEQNVARRSAEARSRLKFLEEQLPTLKQEVEDKEEELSEFRSKSGTISIPDETRDLLSQAVKLENQRLELKLKQDELRQRYTPEHPALKTVNRQLGALSEAEAELGVHIDQLPQSQRDLLRLERDAQVNTQLYISLLNNAQALRVAEAGTIGNVRIIDFAVVPERAVKPKRALIAAASALLGLMLGIIAAFIRRFLRPAVQSAEQLEHRLGLTNYVSLPESQTQKRFRIAVPGRRPRSEGGTSVLAFSQPQEPVIESLRSLRTGLSFALLGSAGKAVAITGATAGVGKSFISVNLAAVLASTEQNVLVLDTDLRRGRLHDYFGYPRKQQGLSDVLAGQCSFEDVVVKVNDNLFVLPAGTIPPNPGELLLSDRFATLMAQLEEKYDRIVIDTAPLLPVADTLAVLQYVAAAFLVVRAEQSTMAEVSDAVGRLRAAGLEDKLKGTLFNGVRRYRVGYGASYKYYYTYE